MEKTNNLMNEALVEAGDVATMKDIYVYSIVGGVLRGVTTKSVVKGINYGIWGLGAQIIFNVAARMIINRVAS
jgi:hypothetical protein